MKKSFLILFLSISLFAKAQYYSIDTIPYNPAPYTGTSIALGGNSFSPLIPIGFPFCFYGTVCDSLTIGANGVVSFWKGYDEIIDQCNNHISDISLPQPWSAMTIGMSVMFPWQDLDPSLGGSITYSSSGVAPNRVFVVSFDNVPMDSCSMVFTGQVKLFEITNIIETHIANKDTCLSWNGGRAAHGLQGPAILPLGPNPAAYGDFVIGRNFPNCVWTATNDGIRFSPMVNVCLPLSVNENDPTQSDFSLYPNPAHQSATLQFNNPQSENFSLTIYNACGQLVREINNITTDKVIIERQDLKSGMYFLRLTAEGKLLGTGKIIME